MKTCPRLLQLCVLLIMAMLLSGCENMRSDLWKQQHEVLNDIDKSYRAYLIADVLHARQILEEIVRLLEDDKVLGRVGLARGLFEEFSRLYVFDKRTGDKKSADVDLIKVHYWLVRTLELNGLPSNTVMEKIQSANGDDILAMVDKQDKAATSGIGPKYLQEISEKNR